MANEKKRKKTEKKPKNAAKVLAGLFLMLYIPSIINWVYGNNVSIDRLRNGTIEKSINTNAVIVRDSVVYKADYNGIYIPDVGDGEKVPAGHRVASVYGESAVEHLASLKSMEIKLADANREKGENAQVFDADLKRIEKEIENKINQIVRITMTNSMNGLVGIQHEINELVSKRSYILGDSGTTDVYIKSLNEEKEKIEQRINLNKTEIIVENPGVVSYNIDGYEDVFSVDRLDSITTDLLKEIKYTPHGYDATNEVTAGTPFVKLIQGVYYYIVASLDSEQADIFDEGERIRIRINEIEKETDAELILKNQEKSGKTVLIFEVDRYMEMTIQVRRLSVDLIKNKYEGMVVPVKSLINPDYSGMAAGIMLVRAGRASYRRVRIKGTNGEMAIIADDESDEGEIALYDSYIINPKNVKDGQLVGNG